MRHRSIASISLCSLLIGGLGVDGKTQEGDRKDRPGTVQNPLPPSLDVPDAPVLSPQVALGSFEVAAGYRIELVAAEPLIHDPVAAAFDVHGRLFVVEMRGYMPDADGRGEGEANGRVVVLRDVDGDGQMDRATAFVEGLVLPRAVLPLRDGALVIAPPRVLFFRDDDLNDRADGDGEVIADGLAQGLVNPEHAINDPELGADGWIRFARYGARLAGWRDGDWRFEPVTAAGQWGLSHDDHDRYYTNGNSDCLRAHLFPVWLANGFHAMRGVGHQVVTDQEVWPLRMTPGVNRGYREGFLRGDWTLRRFTGACGPHVYRGTGMPELCGDAFVAEPTGNLVRHVAVDSGDDGTGLRVRGSNPHGRSEFLRSTDERFRPVGFCDGPDGALYVVDFYRGLIQHRLFLTSWLRKQVEDRGLADPVGCGRIWRVVADGNGAVTRRQRQRPWIAGPSKPAELVDALAHPDGWWRDRAQQRLLELCQVAPRGTRLAMGRQLARFVAGSGPWTGRRHALWALEQLGQRSEVMWAALDDRVPAVRRSAVFVAASRFAAGSRNRVTLGRLVGLALDDEHPAVRHAALIAISCYPLKTGRARAFTDVAEAARGFRDPMVRDAVVAIGRGIEVVAVHALDPELESSTSIARGLAEQAMRRRDAAAVASILHAVAGAPSGWAAEGLLSGLEQGAPSVGTEPLALAHAPRKALRLASRGEERLAAVLDCCTWPQKRAGDPRPLTVDESKLVEEGALLYQRICAACHRQDGSGGIGVAPPLRGSEWVTGDAGRLIRIMLHGVSGPIRVGGQVFRGATMPGVGAQLDDRELAAIGSFVRRGLGHAVEPVAPADVHAVRAETKGRRRPWRVDEL